jgi:demethoxyubiquinone hydroxylase (CLK1/Coq7/Cat5 family)
VAGVPGSVAGTLRHLKSLRQMKRDHGWIHTLIQEAENERMHLMTAIHLYQPSRAFRAVVWLTQGILFNFFFLAYLVSPRFCHRFVGYLEEEAVKTYTRCLSEIDKGNLPKWNALPAPPVAKKYWNMKEGSTIRDVIAVIRADEAHHRDVNHTFASLKGSEPNPFDARP